MPRGAVPALIAFGAVLVLTARGGGFLAETWGWAALPLLLVTIVALVASGDLALGRGQAAALLLLAGVVAWTALSALWAPSPGDPLLEAERTTIYLAAVAAVLFTGSRASTDRIAAGVLAACFAVCAWALWGKLVTHHGVPTTGSDAGRLAGPVGYSNGLGLIAAIGILLALGFAARTHWTAAALVVLGPAFVLTYSRGSWVALGAGLLVLGATRIRDRRTIRFASAVVAALALAGAAVALHGGHAASRLASASSSGRSAYWHVALDEARAHPLVGGGAGTWARWWLQRRPNIDNALDAHSLYLETLAELGAAGLLLLLAALAVPLLALRRRPSATTAACGAGYVAFLVHAVLDWDWELPAVALVGLLCGSALLADESRSLRLGSRARLALLTAALAVGGGVFVLQVGNSALAAGDSARDRGELARALTDARRAHDWQPWSTRPQLELGEARLAAGDLSGAAQELEAALRRDPGDWELWYQLALATTGSRHRQAAGRAAALNPRGPRP